MEHFAELGFLLGVATFVAIIMRLLKQPLIIGHILTGLLVGPFVFNLIHSQDSLTFLSEIGIAILLFTVGLHLNTDVIRQFGRVALITGVGQVLVTTLFGFFICRVLGFSALEAFYIAIALTFSSTIIIMKLLADKGDLETLYAKIAIGFLLVQDLVAILLLLALPLFSSGAFSVAHLVRFLVSGAVLVCFVVLASRFILHASSFVSRSHEFLFLFASAWGIGIAALFHYFGFSLESGALVAGVALASLPARREISSKLMPLRDFFIVLFFILLGSQMQVGDLGALLQPALILSAFVLIGNPLIMLVLMGVLGYRKKTSLQLGLAIAQVSEFSLILIALAVQLGQIPPALLSLVTLVGLITIFGSSYMITYSETLYRFLRPVLGIFERKNARGRDTKHPAYPIILFGCNRIGHDFLHSLKEVGDRFLVIDHDPERIENLTRQGIPVAYGDAGDIDFLESIDMSAVQLAISTVPEGETNALIHRLVKSANPEAIVLVVAHRITDALTRYEEGVDYVILPHFLGGQYAAELILKYKTDRERYAHLRGRHIHDLKLRLSVGHEHPPQEK